MYKLKEGDEKEIRMLEAAILIAVPDLSLEVRQV